MSLDQVLNSVPENTPRPDLPEAPAEETPQTPAPEAEVPQKTGTETPAAMPAAKPEPATMPYAAYKAEKEKRQELEQQLQQRQQSQQEQPKPPGFWDNPEQHLQSVQLAGRMEALAVKLDLTEDAARSKYPDFDEKLTVFAQLAETDPTLKVQMFQARNPAEFAYSVAKNHATVKEAGSLEQIREQIRAEERAKIEAEMKAKADADAKKRAAIPETLTGVQTSAPKAAEFLGPTPLDAILQK